MEVADSNTRGSLTALLKIPSPRIDHYMPRDAFPPRALPNLALHDLLRPRIDQSDHQSTEGNILGAMDSIEEEGTPPTNNDQEDAWLTTQSVPPHTSKVQDESTEVE
jgi:hypothetical protein